MNLSSLKAFWDAEQLQAKHSASSSWLPTRYIAGLDISFDHEHEMVPDDFTDLNNAFGTLGTLCIACLSIFDLESHALVDQFLVRSLLEVPYIPGYLGFREIPLYRELLRRYRDNRPEWFEKTVFMVDGNGSLHPKRFGSAVHLGVSEKVRTLGVAKNLLNMPEAGRELTSEYVKSEAVRSQLKDKGDFVLLRGRKLDGVESEDSDAQFVYGAALIASSTSQNPIFISTGNGLDLETCIDLVLRTTTTRIPEPIRSSDIASRAELASLIKARDEGKEVELLRVSAHGGLA
jgi:deoxyinosine 3'endonuclease (endonuclease V)